MNQSKRIRLAVFLGFLAALAPLSTDMYLPALPIMNNEFAVPTSVIQMTLTATMAGMALGQLFVGPLLDRFGRRLPLIVGMGLFAASTMGCVAAQNIYYFLLFRFVQGASGSFGIVAARAIARDVCTGAELTRFVSLLMLINGLAPIIAPMLGGQIILFGSWRHIFTVLTVVGIALTLSSLLMKETMPPANRVKNLFTGFSLYRKLLRDKYFVGHCLIQCTIFGAFFAYISGSPFLFQNIYHVSPQTFGLIFGALGFCITLSGLVPMRLAGRVPDIKMMSWATGQAFVGSLLFLFCVVAGLPMPQTTAALIVFIVTIPIIGSTGFSLSMRNHGKDAGAASALFGFASMSASGLVAPLVGIGGSETAVPMAIIILVGAVLTLLIFLRTVYFVHRKGRKLAAK